MIRRASMLLLPVVLLWGCQPDKATTEDVHARTQAIITNAVTNSVSSITALSAMEFVTSLQNASPAFDSASGLFDKLLGFGVGTSPDPVTPPAPRPNKQATTCTELPDGTTDCVTESTPPDPQEVADAINQWLEEHIFNEANVESSTESSVVYLLKGESVCPTITTCEMSCNIDGVCTESTCIEEQDAACITLVDDAQIRIEATLIGEDGVDLTFMLGADKISPFTLELRPASIAAEVDLANVKLAIESMSRLFGESPEGLPSVMNGVVRFSLTVNGEQDVSLDAGVVEAVHVVVDGPNGPIVVDLADSNWAVRAAGLVGQLSVAAAVSAIDLVLPYADVTDDPTSTGSMSFHLDGLTFDTTLDAAVQALTVNGIGLGAAPSFIKKDDVTIFQLDVNAAAGRQLGLSVVPDDAAASALFTVTPELDVTALFNLAAIAADFPDTESFFLNETYRIHLFGAGSASVLPLAATDTWGGGLKVVAGALEISSTAVDAPVVVGEGMCLTGVDPVPAEAHPVLGGFAVVACP